MRAARHIGTVLAIALAAPAAFAHQANETAAFSKWSFEPAVVVPLAIAGLLFAVGAFRRFTRSGWSSAQLGCFTAGWLTLVVALVTPVHALGSVLFSVHMTQHELLMIVAAPLLVLSQPTTWFLWALPQHWRHSAGALVKRPPVAALWSVMT